MKNIKTISYKNSTFALMHGCYIYYVIHSPETDRNYDGRLIGTRFLNLHPEYFIYFPIQPSLEILQFCTSLQSEDQYYKDFDFEKSLNIDHFKRFELVNNTDLSEILKDIEYYIDSDNSLYVDDKNDKISTILILNGIIKNENS